MALVRVGPPRFDGEARKTLFDLFAERLPINVINRSGAIVILSLSQDRAHGIEIPPGPDPLCLTESVSHKQLRECDDLFVAVNAGALVIKTDEFVQKYYTMNEGRANVVEERLRMMHERVKDMKEENIDAVPVKITPRVQGIVAQLSRGRMDEDTAFRELDAIQEKLTIDDISFLRSNAKPMLIKTWADDLYMDKLGVETPIPVGVRIPVSAPSAASMGLPTNSPVPVKGSGQGQILETPDNVKKELGLNVEVKPGQATPGASLARSTRSEPKPQV